MALIVKDNGGTFELPPAGTHLARCYQVIDLGTQVQEYQGVQNEYPKLLLGWELCYESNQDGQPFTLWKRYTASLSEKSILRKDLETWRGKPFSEEELGGFNVGNIIGAYCFLNLIHKEVNGKNYANVAAVMALPKGAEKPPALYPSIYFDLSPALYSQSIFDSFSDGLKKTITQSPEWKSLNGQAFSDAHEIATVEQIQEDLPF